MVDSRGEVTISNDGATIMKLLDIVHPAAKTLVDIARSQDAEVKKKKKKNGYIIVSQHVILFFFKKKRSVMVLQALFCLLVNY